jgi:hypothetical protein
VCSSSFFSTSLSTFVVACFLDTWHSVCGNMQSPCCFDFHLLSILILFYVFIGHLYYFWELFNPFAHLLIGVLVFILNVLHIFQILILYPMNSLQNCFPNCRWSLDSSKFFLAGQKFFKLMKFHLSLFNLNSWTIGVLFRNALPIPIISGVCFSPIVWMFQDLIFRSFIYFELILHRVRDRSLVSVFYIWISSFPNTICWGARLFSSIYFGCFCQKKKSMAIAVWLYFWVLYLIHWSTCLSLHQYRAVFIAMAL